MSSVGVRGCSSPAHSAPRDYLLRTSAGPVAVGWDGRRITSVRLDAAGDVRKVPARREALPPLLRRLERDLSAYFGGRTIAWSDYPLAPGGTAFRRAVWSALRRIPRGRVRTYGDIARAIGRPAASRAVGQACGANPIPILIPCHRVVAAGGSLGGFSGGLGRKRQLLGIEGVAL